MLAHMMRHVLYQCSLDARKSVSTANTGLQRYLSAVSDLRLFGRESAETEGIIDAYERQVNLNIKQTLLQQSLLPVYALLAGVGVVIVIALGGGNVKSGEWTIGTFNAYMVMFVAFTGRTRVAAKVFNKWHSAKAAWVRVKEKMVIDGAVTTKDDPLRIVTGINQIKINNLQFAYGDRPILKDINFNIKAGEIIGITGAIGSGKSTLLNVLTGQYDYEGQILFDQIHLNELSEETKQAMIGYSGHDSFLFSMSIEDNIHFSTSQVNSAEMEKCVTSVALKDDLERFENRLQTEVGEKGLKVSGGQKQRIAMARAIYNQPPLVLLDDPFSALDIATERRIVDRLRQDFKNQMVVIATHRLSVFEYVDRVLVLDQGKIIESGTHPELMRQKGLYAEIFNAQQFIEGGAANETCTE
jgi:ABC-type bacteriocin/lantibiotic exporter with double-glycine peptidase domain